tara:strand:- start:51 stop:1385 length:1335 start_codon:yes stop_codon:yes gene_type:complete
MSKEDVLSAMTMMQGSFEGIGIEFAIHRDTIVIVSVIDNGPSEKAGVIAGGRIIMIEQDTVAGKGFKNQDVIKKLRGKRGTIVKIGVQESRSEEIQFFSIIRDKIPLESLDVAYEIAPQVGYIKLNRFSATTFSEFKSELKRLKKEHSIESLILDLRGNSGGYLDQAIDILNEFFKGGELLVYTKGNSRKEKKYFSNSFGIFKNQPLCVLIDEGSASASEIVAGAIQDHDRGHVIGERSFGKGLVQEQIALEDGSVIRLTVSRYYTPSGRCIQKPYSDNQEEYFSETFSRNPETETDTLKKFTTKKGGIVYGGGGITPEYIIKSKYDSLPTSLVHLYISDFFKNLAFDYVDVHRDQLEKIEMDNFIISKWQEKEILSQISKWMIAEMGDNFTENLTREELAQHQFNIINRLSALIIRQFWGWEEMQIFLNQHDEIITTSLSLLK